MRGLESRFMSTSCYVVECIAIATVLRGNIGQDLSFARVDDDQIPDI